MTLNLRPDDFVLGDRSCSNFFITSGGYQDIPIVRQPSGIIASSTGSATCIFDGTVDSQHTYFTASSDVPLQGSFDEATGQFSMHTNLTTSTNETIDVTLVGRAVNRPPVAVATSPETVECSQSGGALVSLDGSGSFDPDNDIISYVWRMVTPAGHVFVARGKTATVLAPLGATEYELMVMDSRNQTSRARTLTHVVDSLPPSVTLTATPSCIWPPDRKWFEWKLGAGLDVEETDACDRHPSIRVLDVQITENNLVRPASSDDAQWSGSAVCLLAARDGASATGRRYTVRVRVTDGSGNKTDQAVEVEVPHDSRPADRCSDGALHVETPSVDCRPVTP